MQFCPFHILTKGGQGGGEPGGLGGECRKKRGCFPGQSAFRRQTGGRERCIRQKLCRGGESSGLGSPPPLSGSWKKSSLIGSLAVSFTLNIKVHQIVRRLCVGKGEERVSRGVWAGTVVLPSPPPCGPSVCRPSSTTTRVLCGPGERPLCWPSQGACAHHPHPDSTLQSKQINATGRGRPQHPKPKHLPPAQYCSLD